MSNTTVKHLIHNAWAKGIKAEDVVSVLLENDVEITIELVRDLYAKWDAELPVAPLIH